MTERTLEQSPRSKVRTAGVFYLLTILTGASGLLAPGPLGSAILLSSTACYIVVAVLFYGLFRAVNRHVSALAAVFSRWGVPCRSCGSLVSNHSTLTYSCFWAAIVSRSATSFSVQLFCPEFWVY